MPLKITTSVCSHLWSQVLKNHSIPQGLMDNILPINSFYNYLSVLNYIFLFPGCILMAVAIGVPIFALLMTSLSSTFYFFELVLFNCEQWDLKSRPYCQTVDTPQYWVLTPGELQLPVFTLTRKSRRTYQRRQH